MKPKFITEGKQIYFQDRNGQKWSADCVDNAFRIAQWFNKIIEYAEHYSSKRVDGKDFYKDMENPSKK